MWGRRTLARLLGAIFVALGAVAACGGRSARERPGVEDGSGGTGGVGGGNGGTAGTLTLTGGSAGMLGSSAGATGVLRPCASTPVPVELLAECRLPLRSIASERPLDPDFVTFALRLGDQKELLPRVEPGPCERGWYLTEDGSTVVLCPDVCSEISSPAVTLEIAYACDGIPPRN